MVLLIRDAVLSPGSTQRWVAGMRGQMRPSDLAGMLVEGEIGLLMHDTTAQHAKIIASRLRAVVDGLPGADTILIGVATRVPGLPIVDGIVREARADALRNRTSESNVAIVREVGPDSCAYVVIIQQNWENTKADNAKTLLMSVNGGKTATSTAAKS